MKNQKLDELDKFSNLFEIVLTVYPSLLCFNRNRTTVCKFRIYIYKSKAIRYLCNKFFS